MEGCLAKHQELEEENKSSGDEEEEEPTSIKSYDTALTLARDLMKFLEEKGEDKVAEGQHKVLSAFQDVKLQNYKKQSTVYDFIHQSQS